MADGYVKLLSSILDSSIWQEPDDVIRVWITMLAMADRDGFVGASVGGIARRTVTVSVERVRECLDLFQSPDIDSRSEEFEGRRIQKVDRGWLILNYAKIRDLHGAESQRAAKRRWWKENRGKTSSLDTPRTLDVSRRNPMDLDLDLNSQIDQPDRSPTPTDLGKRDRFASSFEQPDSEAKELFEVWKYETGKTGATYDHKAREFFERIRLEGVTVDEVKAVVLGAKLDDWAVDKAKLSAKAILGSSEQREKFKDAAKKSKKSDVLYASDIGLPI